MIRREWFWRLALACWSAAVMSFFIPGVSEASVVELGEFRFRFSDMLTLFAIGLAWGDLRQWRSNAEKRLDRIEKKLEGE